ncbi:hypothetical protein LP417_22850 [Polaromonas sp. P1-6]|nr:hypothetical protein LP417_22850 [Polaromonas sp. P1-6]
MNCATAMEPPAWELFLGWQTLSPAAVAAHLDDAALQIVFTSISPAFSS